MQDEEKSQLAKKSISKKVNLELKPFGEPEVLPKEYLLYQKKMTNFQCPSSEFLRKKLFQNQVFEQKMFRPSLEKKIIKKTGNSYIFTLIIGNFQTEISLLKVKFNSQFFQRIQYSQGNFATIYLENFGGKTFVIKSQNMSEQSSSDLGDEVDEILKEYFAYRIASILEYGPKLDKLFGYDIVCFTNAVEFSMQFCQLPSKQDGQKRNNLEKDLFSDLKTMHQLQIVHSDIKKANISWSQYFNKWVFLDFGFTSFLFQKPGQKTVAHFKGTYNYVSKQMKSLFHLKSQGYVDLYANDVHGLQIVISQFSLKSSTSKVIVQKQPLHLLFIFLSRMKKSIFVQNVFQIQRIFQENTPLRNEFLGLILAEISISKQINQMTEPHPLFFLYRKLKAMITINPLKKIIYQQEKQKYLINSFLREDNEDLKSVFLYENQQNFKKILETSWGSFSLMKKLFLFFNEAFYSNKKIYLNRLKEIINIIYSFKTNNPKGKSWFYKFHKILLYFQQFFIQKNSMQILLQIKAYYHFFHDQAGYKRLQNFSPETQVHKIQILFYDFFSNAFELSSREFLEGELVTLKSQYRKNSFDTQIYSILLKMAELTVEIVSEKQLSKQSERKFQECFAKFENYSFSLQNQLFPNLIKFQISSWKNKFQISYLSTKLMKNQQKAIFRNTKSTRISFKYALEKLQSLKSATCYQTEFFFEVYPIFQEIPRLFNFQYNLKKKNYEKVNQIVENIYELNKFNLEDIIDDAIYLLKRWKSVENIKEELQFMLDTFIRHFQRGISVDKIKSYWNFFIKICFTLNFKKLGLDQNRKDQILLSLGFMINFYKSRSLSETETVYLNLFISLTQFIENDRIKAFQSLEKISLDQKLKENPLLLAQIIQCYLYYQQDCHLCMFQNTKLYHSIIQDEMINWFYFKVPVFFEYALSSKSKLEGPRAVFEVIKQFTSYLTHIEGRLSILSNIFFLFIENQTQINKENIMEIILQEEMKAFRENNFLSTFIFMLFLKTEASLYKKFTKKKISRLLLLSMISISKYPHEQRLHYESVIQYKFRVFEGKLGKRKKKILDRREDYAKGILIFIAKHIDKKLNKINNIKVKSILKKKLRALQNNMSQKIDTNTDIKIVKISEAMKGTNKK